MDEEMEDMVMLTFTAVEIDPDYEFDAAQYFDFSREESLAEAREAELWFESAGTYPPSPLVKKLLLRKDILMENVTTSPKNKKLESMAVPENIGMDQEISAVDMSNREYEGINGRISVDVKSCILPNFNQTHCIPTGLTFYNHTIESKAKRNTTAKPSVPRTSTLMKLTASQLAKQSRSHQVGDSRLLKFENKEKSLNNSSTLESQASKRQKLEGGQLRKVTDTNQQAHLVHKEPKRDGNIGGNSAHAKLRLTIPRQPDLKTAQRAQRIRPKVSSEREREQETSTAPLFKALPLNRKILDAPSLILPKRSTPRLPDFQEFHLKTSERAMQHNSAVPSYSVLHQPCVGSIAECSNSDPRRPNIVAAPKPQGCEIAHNFKALPLNKKIFSSKGDLGVF